MTPDKSSALRNSMSDQLNRETKGNRGILLKILLTIHALAFLFLISSIHGMIAETIYHDHYLMEAYSDSKHLPSATNYFALPVMAGIGDNIFPQTVVTYISWLIIIGWPIATITYLWLSKNNEKMRWVYLFSMFSYLIFIIAISFFTGLCMVTPFLH